MKRNFELEDENRQQRAIIEQHSIVIKIECHDVANMAYIHSFSNAIWATHRMGIDLEGIWYQMWDMLVAYMRNNPVRIENHLPLKNWLPSA